MGTEQKRVSKLVRLGPGLLGYFELYVPNYLAGFKEINGSEYAVYSVPFSVALQAIAEYVGSYSPRYLAQLYSELRGVGAMIELRSSSAIHIAYPISEAPLSPPLITAITPSGRRRVIAINRLLAKRMGLRDYQSIVVRGFTLDGFRDFELRAYVAYLLQRVRIILRTDYPLGRVLITEIIQQ